jgi:3-oxoadipate enol-lactonase
VEIEPRRLRSWDGTDLAWYEIGDPEAPPMVFCSGLGGGVLIWKPLIERFASRFRLIGWDYRGLYHSGRPPHDGAYDLIHHVLELLDQTGAEAPVLVGWSMGVQRGLELHRHHPGRVSALVAIHGAAGRPLDTAFDSPLTARIAPLVFGLMRAVGTRFGTVGPALARTPLVVRSFVEIGRRLRCMSPDISIPGFRDMGEEWTRLDLDAYARIFEALGAHDASDLLPRVEAPTLVVAGSADLFTPLGLAEAMVEALPDATLEVIQGATHFGLLEYGDQIADTVERFVETRGLAAGRASPSRRPRGGPQPRIVSA